MRRVGVSEVALAAFKKRASHAGMDLDSGLQYLSCKA